MADEQDDMAAAWEAEMAAAESNSGADDAFAAEWEAMVGAETGKTITASSIGIERVLNQDEIDNLLGFDVGDDNSDGNSGIHGIINSALVSYERLPMLEIVFDRLVRYMTTSLRNFTSDNVEVSLDHISSIRFGDYLNSIPLPAILAVFRAKQLDNFGLMTVDSNLIYSIVDVLLGGRKGTTAMRIEGRPYTTIERMLVTKMIDVILEDMALAFKPIKEVDFNLDRIETNPRFAAIARPANAAIMVKMRIDMEDRGGRVELLLPYATLEPVRNMLIQQFMGEKFGRDNIWEGHLATELWSTDMEVEAVLDELPVPLGRMLDLQVGETIFLNQTQDGPIELKCGEISLTKGRMGRVGNNIALRVDRPLNRGTKLEFFK
jgi:flagellar motor switch protein FliM